MRGFVERKSLVTALATRRNYSAGIGRGRGEGIGNYGDTEESVFRASYGHGVPLNSAGRGGPLNAGSLDRRGPRDPGSGASEANYSLQFGSSPAGRGFGNRNQTDPTDTFSGPFRAGSLLQRSGEDAFSNRRPLTKASLNYTSAGFGRGKPVEKVSVTEDIFSPDNRSSLSSWSKWDDKSNKSNPKDGASAPESRPLRKDESTNALRFPAVPQQPRSLEEDRQTEGLQSSTNATPFHAAPYQQPPSPSSHGGQPIPQTYVDFRVQPQPFSYMAPSTGWQQPIQQSYYDARLQMQPSMEYPPAQTGWPQSENMSKSYQYTDRQAVCSEVGFGKPYGGTPHGSVEEPSYFSTPARELAQEGVQNSYPDTTCLFHNETEQPLWASNTPETNQETHAAYAPGGWRSVPTSESMKPPYPSQNLPESKQGQYLYGSESTQSPSLAPDTSDVNGYDYNSGQQFSESFQDIKEQLHVEAPLHVHKGLHYDERIEECFKQGKLEDIDDIYNQMRAAQVRASAKTYGTILQSYMQLGKMDKASVVYQEMSGVLFSDKKTENDQAKKMSSAASRESPILGAQNGGECEDNGESAPPRTSNKNDFLFSSSNTDAEGFTPVGRSESIAKTGMGRGKKMDSFFNFDFSGGLGSGGSACYGKESIQADQGSNLEMHDDYSQTFTPVVEPGWYAFAPQAVSLGRGAGRGQPHSPQAVDSGIGSSMPIPSQQFSSMLTTGAGRGRPHSPQAVDSRIASSMPIPSQQYDSGSDQGRSSYEQHMQVALQKSPPLYSSDVPAEPDPEFLEEPPQPLLSTEEAAERAMRILNTRSSRLSRIYKKLKGWELNYDEDAAKVRRRSPVQLTQALALNEKKQPKKSVKVEKEIYLTDEEAKKEAARLKAIEESEALRELYYTFEQFMKCYGEMALEPEHELGDFTNPDIEERPFMPLEEYLEKAKPNIMKTGLIRTEKEWQNTVKETLKYAPYLEEFVERYSGPGRYTAKQENDDLEEIASALPSDVGRGAKAFVQRSLTTLKSNPGFNLDEKQWMLATMVDEFSQFSVQD